MASFRRFTRHQSDSAGVVSREVGEEVLEQNWATGGHCSMFLELRYFYCADPGGRRPTVAVMFHRRTVPEATMLCLFFVYELLFQLSANCDFVLLSRGSQRWLP